MGGSYKKNEYDLYSDICMYNVSTHKETQITSDKSDQTSPAIYGDKIVWQEDKDGNCNIYMYDLSNHKKTQISTSGRAFRGYPAIFGDRIVWVDDRNEKSNIYMYNLSTCKETRTSNNGPASYPAIYDDKIVWVDDLMETPMSTCMISSPKSKFILPINRIRHLLIYMRIR